MSRRLSIKLRLTLWFAVFMTLLALVALGFILLNGDALLRRDTEGLLRETVDGNAEELSYQEGKLTIGEAFAFYRNGVYTVIYDSDGVYLAGQIPVGISVSEPLTEGQLQQGTSDGSQHYWYDRKVYFDGETHVWLRGIALEEGAVSIVGAVTRLALVALPFLLLLAVAGGYMLTKRALAPVEQIRQAAASINEGKDLSARIGLPPGNDEIHHLAETFDSMFARLEQSFEAEKQFTANASHELRTPITVILAQCDALEKNAQTEAEFLQGIAVIQRQASKMSRLAGQLLSLSRMERGVETVYFEQTDLSELVMIICQQQAEVFPQESISTDIQPECYGWVDVGLIARALENLLENAVKYGHGQTVVSLHRAGEAYWLAVRDNGPGIAADQLTKIWERFYQVDASRGEDGGMGLGLAMVRQIMTLHNGAAWAESEPGQGSVFILSIPVKPSVP